MSLIIKKASIKDINDYLALLNKYYSQYAEFLLFSPSREKKKRLLLKLLGLISKKYREQNHLFVIYDGINRIGFNEYTNHKVGLLCGYLKSPNIHMDQTHLHEEYYGKGYARQIWTNIISNFPKETVISTTIEVNNLPSHKAAVKFGFEPYKTLQYYELHANDLQSGQYAKPESAKLKKYTACHSQLLYKLYKDSTPADVYRKEKLAEYTFSESLFDLVLNKLVRILSGVNESHYFVMKGDHPIGYIALKFKNRQSEFKLLFQKGQIDSIRYYVNLLLQKELKAGIKKFAIYINSYQEDEIQVLEEMGFTLQRSLYEYVMVSKGGEL